MKCFRHPASDAVAVCRQCGRAVCEHCHLDNEAEKVLCSTACNQAAKREALLQEIVAEEALTSFYGLKGALTLLKLLGGICLLMAAGELVGAFFLANPFGGVGPLDLVSSLGFAMAMVLLGISCYVGVRLMRPSVRKRDELVAAFQKQKPTEVPDPDP